ncbi:MAG: DUF4190 domain-containing protein [Clostridia bacterium]|nr:DUF4190 domain-containing protein [Clostridia bacterium]
MNEPNEYRPEDGTNENTQPKGDFYGSDFREYSEPVKKPQENRYTYEAVKLDLGKPKTKAFSIVSLITGIVSLISCCTMVLPVICGVLAIVFAIVAKKHLGYFDTMALLGLIFGIFGFLFGVVILIGIVTLSLDETFWEMIEEIEQSYPSGDISGSF